MKKSIGDFYMFSTKEMTKAISEEIQFNIQSRDIKYYPLKLNKIKVGKAAVFLGTGNPQSDGCVYALHSNKKIKKEDVDLDKINLEKAEIWPEIIKSENEKLMDKYQYHCIFNIINVGE